MSSYDHFGTSYTANIFLTGSSNGQGKLASNSPYLHRASQIPAPTRTLTYWENAGRWAWAVDDACPSVNGVNPHTPDGTIGGWHGKAWTFAAAFCDGHVATIFMHGHSQQRESWWPPGLSFPNGGCILVRGDSWQLDTLPLRPTETDLNAVGGGKRASYEDCVGD